MSLTSKETTENFETWLNKPFVSAELKQSLADASILILPTEGFRNHEGPLFPVHTSELYEFLKSKMPEDTIIDICVDSDNFKELALHSDYKRIGNFIVKEMALPLLIGLILLYAQQKYFKDDQSSSTQVVSTTNGASTTVNNSPNTTVVNTNVTVVEKEKPVEEEKPPVKKYHNPPKIKFSYTVVDTTGACKEFEFEGTAKDLETVVEGLNKLNGDGDR